MGLVEMRMELVRLDEVDLEVDSDFSNHYIYNLLQLCRMNNLPVFLFSYPKANIELFVFFAEFFVN